MTLSRRLARLEAAVVCPACRARDAETEARYERLVLSLRQALDVQHGDPEAIRVELGRMRGRTAELEQMLAEVEHDTR